ncbi:Myosin II heavy chain-like protein [Corchorus capsularis]|uniref:Myosin II heavy chain-like protein n=1 Tax=Corchorus capsularis TaxID=210143 RepID=A0A1R3I392_COCAP|nr:Myosin II heavy chain-like protein [Corchorus capsularis]
MKEKRQGRLRLSGFQKLLKKKGSPNPLFTVNSLKRCQAKPSAQTETAKEMDETFGGDVQAQHPDPVVLELTRLQNQLKEKERELGAAQAEIKALRASEVFKDKAIEELQSEVDKLDEKHRAAENLLQHKNLEIKKLTDDKRDALAAQFAAEATLRRVHANQKDEADFSLESVIAPLEAEIKMYKNEIAQLHEDKKAMERLTKSKESALLEAERILRSALERALIVEEVQNQNFELRRQIEICQEENKILEKTNRQKVLEVEKLSQTIQELEEAILAGGAAANSIRDYQRQISQLNEEKRTLERELARAKVSANRVATVVANEWKDENDKVMPVKQWLDDRRLLQAEMQRLKEKLAVSERTAKAEAQLKEKFKLRLKILEDGLKHVSSFSVNPKNNASSPKPEKTSNLLGFLTSSGGLRKRSKVADSSEKENAEILKVSTNSNVSNQDGDSTSTATATASDERKNNENRGNAEDMVSGFLYDRLQKEVINLRKCCEAKDSSLNAKNEEIKILIKKVEAFSRALEVESKRVKREAIAKEKELGSAKMDDIKRIKTINSSSRRLSKAS